MMAVIFGLLCIVSVLLVEFISWTISQKYCKLKASLGGIDTSPGSVLMKMLGVKAYRCPVVYSSSLYRYPIGLVIYLMIYSTVWVALLMLASFSLNIVFLFGLPGVWLLGNRVVKFIAYPFSESTLKRKLLKNDPELREKYLRDNHMFTHDPLVKYCNQLDRKKQIVVNDYNEFEIDGQLYELRRK